MKNNNNALIFSACHALTRALVANTRYNYKATFTACLKLAYNDYPAFITSCKIYATDTINTINLAKISDNDFNFYGFLPFIDSDKKTYAKFDKCVNFAVNYGLKKRDAFRTKKEIYYDTVSDNYNPVAVSDMRKNAYDDLKQDVIMYMLNRIDDSDFLALPNIYKLLRAGDAVVSNFCQKEQRKSKIESGLSVDGLKESGFQFADGVDYTETVTIDGLIQDISLHVPKKHRDLACDIIRCRHISKSGNVVNKYRNFNQIADILGVSVRTVKTVWGEIKSLNADMFR